MHTLKSEEALLLSNITLPSLEREQQTTLRVIEAIPVDKADYKPDANSMSALELASHIASAEHLFLSAVARGAFDFTPGEKPKSIPEVVSVYKENFAKDLAGLKAMTGEQLAQQVDFRGMLQMPAVQFLEFSIRHIIHHRGQLSVYLRPMGGKVPAIYGESFDSKAAKAAKG